MRSRISFIILSLVAVSAMSGCARKGNEVRTLSLTREAYALMDHGQNAKAILLLEERIATAPEDMEARVMLASAYLGQTGVDVYKIYERFRDLLFAKPLSDAFNPDDHSDGDDAEASDIPQAQTPGEEVVESLDLFIAKFQSGSAFLRRFPRVKKEDWVLLDRALAVLDDAALFPQETTVSPNDSRIPRDLRLYRVFIRVVYLKAFLGETFLQQRDLGSRRWVCQVKAQRASDGLSWTMGHLAQAAQDFATVFPDKSFRLSVLTAWLESIRGVFTSDSQLSAEPGDVSSESTTPVGVGTASQVSFGRFRTLMGCGELSNPLSAPAQVSIPRPPSRDLIIIGSERSPDSRTL